MFSIFKKQASSIADELFTIENLPFIFQSEYYSLAWGKRHYGFYIAPDGRKYRYDMPEEWNFYSCPNEKMVWGYETDGIISPESLFQNLRSSTEVLRLFPMMRRKAPITQTIIDDLFASQVKYGDRYMCDAGIRSNALLVYEQETGLYKRILLRASGDREMVNKSDYALPIVLALGEASLR
ncbi:hypothetical protein VRU48_08080 [Pedobacter sp. KR3-3]|uniref:Immunity protein 35 domain-containing protein n=1 Tax=Pedobacter albus TaxID=3113905 RepID=A0ABU7I6H6_9SPHI|nr:hypothetical protein [Pedobacter sp. KR3-3]MEE1945061.1 hypothetical protein [Pedobacter sp. KR3-3]